MILPLLLINTTAMHHFQFTCFDVDICTFPFHYCDVGKDRGFCKPCTNHVCGGEKVPLQCMWNCSIQRYEKTGELVPPLQEAIQDDADVHYVVTADIFSLPTWVLGSCAVGLPFIAFIALVIYTFRLYRQIKEKKKKWDVEMVANKQMEDTAVDSPQAPMLVQRSESQASGRHDLDNIPITGQQRNPTKLVTSMSVATEDNKGHSL